MFRPTGTTESASKAGTTSTSGARKCTTWSARARDDVLFGEGLEPVGDRLEEAIRADAVWAVAVLDPPKAFALQESREGKERREDDHDGGGGKERGKDGLALVGQQTNQPVLRSDKNLVHLFSHLRTSSKREKPISVEFGQRLTMTWRGCFRKRL